MTDVLMGMWSIKIIIHNNWNIETRYYEAGGRSRIYELMNVLYCKRYQKMVKCLRYNVNLLFVFV